MRIFLIFIVTIFLMGFNKKDFKEFISPAVQIATKINNYKIIDEFLKHYSNHHNMKIVGYEIIKNNKIIFKTPIDSEYLKEEFNFNNLKLIIFIKDFFLSKQEKEWIKNNVVIVGVNKNWSPIYLAKDNVPQGIAIDLIKLISKKTSLKIKYYIGTWNEIYQKFLEKKIDILPATYFTKERTKYGFFTTPYLNIINAIYTKLSNIHSIKDLENKTLAIPKNYGTISIIKKKFPKIKILKVKNLDEAIKKVLNNKADALIESQIVMRYRIKQNLISGLNEIVISEIPPLPLHIFVQKDKKILYSIIQKTLNSISPKEKFKIINKWIDKISLLSFLTIKEINYLYKKKNFKMAICNYPPFEFKHENYYKGIMVDYLKNIAKNLNVNINFEYVKCEEKKPFLLKKVDFFVIYDNKNYPNSSNPIIKLPLKMITYKGNKKLKYDSVILIKNKSYNSFIKKKFPNLKFITTNSIKDALNKLSNKEADLVFLEDITADYYLNRIKGVKILKDLDYFINVKMVGNNKHIASIANKLITPISSELIYKYLKKEKNFFDTVYFKIGVRVILFLFLIIIISGAINYYLTKKLKEKTLALQQLIETQDEIIKSQTKHLEEKIEELKLSKKIQENLIQKLQSQKESIEKILNSQEELLIISDLHKMKQVNKAFLNFFEVSSLDEFKEKYGECICETFNNKEGYLPAGKEWKKILQHNPNLIHKASITKNNKEYIFKVDMNQVDEKNFLISFSDITVIEEYSKKLKEINKKLTESIKYASLIQNAILPKEEKLKYLFSDYFAIWMPKDIVGGDIWSFELLRNDNEGLLLVIDCTGHGVPGAFVTMIVKSLEREIIATIKKHSEFDISPAVIMHYFNKNLKLLLKQTSQDTYSNAGFDGGILYYNRKNKLIKYCGANIPLYYLHSGKIEIIKPNKYSVGHKECDINYEYKEKIIHIYDKDRFFITTDGFIDQLGGEKNLPFGKKRFKKLLEENSNTSMQELKQIIIKTFYEWKSDEEQIDDITVIGVEI